jgi:hypothetical protein
MSFTRKVFPQLRNVCVLVGAATIGACTTTALNKNVLDQASTLTLLEQEMILDNLELFRQRREAMPWHIKITSGSISVNDTVTPTYTQSWSPISEMLALAPSRSIQLQWNIVPATSADDLMNLTQLYRADTLDERDDGDPTARPRSCIDNNVPRRFSETFEEGSTRPSEHPYGYYNKVYIWVRKDRASLNCFDLIVRDVFHSAPISDVDRGLMIPLPAQRQIGH